MADESQQQQLLQMHSQTPPQLQPLQQTHPQQNPQSQAQQQQPPPQQQQPQPQQQTVAVTMPMPQNMDQTNAMNQQNSMALNPAMSVSQAQSMAGGQVAVNNNTGTAVHMTVPQLTAPPAPAPAPTAVMSQSSSQHPTMIHPAMSMAQAPLQQVQVIQPSLSASYLQQLYTPQQQMLFPGNLTLQHASMTAPTLQSIGPAQSLSVQLQAKTNMDPKTTVAGQTLQAVSAANKGISFPAGSMMTATGQVIGASSKANFQQQMMTAPGKSTIIHGQPQFAGNTSQAVLMQCVLPNQQSVFNQKALGDSQKKTYMVNQPAALQPKSPIFPSALPPHSTAQVFNGNQLKQLPSSPQLITSQSPGTTVLNQAQFLGSFQTIGASLPGISWAAPGLQSPALLAQNSFVLRGQQSDMFIQSPPQTAVHLPVAAASAPLPPTSYASPTLAPQKPKQARPGSSVATQTVVTTVSTVNANTQPFRNQQIKTRPRTISSHLMPAAIVPQAPQMATSQTQTNQVTHQQGPPQVMVQQKSDAANQTRPMPEMKTIEMKSIATQSKSVGVEAKQLSPTFPKTQAKVVPSVKCTPESSAVAVSLPSPCITSVASVGVATVTYTTTPMLVDNSTGNDPMSEEPCEISEPVVNYLPVQHQEEPVPPPPPLPLPESEVKNLPDDHLPLPTHAKDRHPQKAIVKPHVLTHVIDGFIIQEGPEPFPVSRSSLLTEINPLKPQAVEAPPQPAETTRVVSSKKKKRMHRVRGPVELAKCEFCGKLEEKSKFKCSKRFCSTSCAKRFNLCSKRLGLPPSSQDTVLRGGRKRKKMGFKSRKGWRKSESAKQTYNAASDKLPEEKQNSTSTLPMSETVEEMTESPSGSDSSGAPNPPLQQVEQMEITESHDDATKVPMKSPNKWSVQEVFEFIHDLAGCSDYADEFRSQEIDGQALLLLKEDHLMKEMGMKLGPALKLISRINSIKEDAPLS